MILELAFALVISLFVGLAQWAVAGWRIRLGTVWMLANVIGPMASLLVVAALALAFCLVPHQAQEAALRIGAVYAAYGLALAALPYAANLSVLAITFVWIVNRAPRPEVVVPPVVAVPAI